MFCWTPSAFVVNATLCLCMSQHALKKKTAAAVEETAQGNQKPYSLKTSVIFDRSSSNTQNLSDKLIQINCSLSSVVGAITNST